MATSSILLDLGSDTILCFLKNYLKASKPILSNVHGFSSDVANLLHDYGYNPNFEGQKEKSIKVTLVYKNNSSMLMSHESYLLNLTKKLCCFSFFAS